MIDYAWYRDWGQDSTHMDSTLMPWCCDYGIDAVILGYLFVKVALAAYMFSLSTLLNAQVCCVWSGSLIILYFIPGGGIHMDEIQTSVVTPPLDLHWDQQHVPAWNVDYKVGISRAYKKVSLRTCFRYQPTRPPTRSSRCQPPQPVLELGMFVHVNPCNFLLMGTSYKIPILPTGWNCHGGL